MLIHSLIQSCMNKNIHSQFMGCVGFFLVFAFNDPLNKQNFQSAPCSTLLSLISVPIDSPHSGSCRAYKHPNIAQFNTVQDKEF